jgi:hypothetical protein
VLKHYNCLRGIHILVRRSWGVQRSDQLQHFLLFADENFQRPLCPGMTAPPQTQRPLGPKCPHSLNLWRCCMYDCWQHDICLTLYHTAFVQQVVQDPTTWCTLHAYRLRRAESTATIPTLKFAKRICSSFATRVVVVVWRHAQRLRARSVIICSPNTRKWTKNLRKS